MPKVSNSARIDNRIVYLSELSAAAAEVLESRDPRVKTLFHRLLPLVLRELGGAMA